MAQTNQYGLRQWEREEVPRHGDFNQAMAGVDSALARVAPSKVFPHNLRHLLKLAEINSNAAKLAAKIETLEVGKAKIVLGTYRGDNASSREITLGFQPKAVLLEIVYGKRPTNGDIYGGLAFPGTPLYSPVSGDAMTITPEGFQVYFGPNYLYTNQSGNTYLYLAVQ